VTAVQLVILAFVFAATAGLLVGGWAFVNRQRLSAETAARERLLGRVTPTAAGRAVGILREERASEIEFVNRLLSKRALTTRVARQLSAGGATLAPGEFLARGCLVALCMALAGQWLIPGPLGALGGLALGSVLPVAWLRRIQEARLQRLTQQLPDAIDLLVGAMRAGYSVTAALEFVGAEMAAPLGPEFQRLHDEQRLGVEARVALMRFQERVGTPEVGMLVTAFVVQRETGGNLAEVLAGLGTLMRERVAFKEQVATLTAEPVMSARLITALPAITFGLMYVLQRDFVEPLLTTAKGHQLLLYAAVSIVLGHLVLSRIARVEY
jgi:tight adherence protein B